jgi:adenylate kinase
MMHIKPISFLFIVLGLTISLASYSGIETTQKEQDSPMRMMILGAPGAGKGTQAKLLARRYNIPQISTGDILRQEITKGSPLGLRAKKIMEIGQLLSDDIIFSLVQDRLNKPDCANGFILDGFPRTLVQAKLLKRAKIYIDNIIQIKVDDDEIIKRISGRRIHQASGRVYNLSYNPPKRPGVDDVTGQPLVQRSDDKEEIVKNRLAIYHRLTEPLIDYYETWLNSKSKGAPHIHKISGTKSVDQIFNDIVKSLTVKG